MPHSGGGGSHSGGSHGGHSGGSGSGYSGAVIRSHPFKGAKRYVYYADNKCNYLYSDTDITKIKTNKMSLVLMILFMLFFAATPLYIVFSDVYNHPHAIQMPAQKEIRIEDTIGILSSEEKSEMVLLMTAFREKTGVVPAFVAVHDSEWNSNYSNLEDYAYDKYLEIFPDEKHMLIVYSEPDYYKDFNNWKWELMQGNDTDPVLSVRFDKKFTSLFQAKLSKNGKTAGTALNETFAELTPGVLERGFIFDDQSIQTILFALLFEAMILVIFIPVLIINLNPKRKYYQSAIKITAKAKEETCEYCGCNYVVGTVLSCPHCNAPIPAQVYEEKTID